jgi:SAM-dependent methyltransferase
MPYTAKKLQEYLQWDVATWQHALLLWEKTLDSAFNDLTNLRALEIGARDGGLSLWLAEKGLSVVCSDIFGPSEQAFVLHTQYGLKHRIEHRALDATAIDEPDASFDITLFKSVLGGIGSFNNLNAIEQTMSELYRVLKPGGLLLFAENLRGSWFHRLARYHFVPWGKDWHYPHLDELDDLLALFSERHLYTYGFLSCVKKNFMPFMAFDRLVCRSSCSQSHYMAYGFAKK